MGDWNATQMRQRFEKRMSDLEHRLPAVKTRACEGPTLRALYDDSLAKLIVYRALLEQASWTSRENFLAALASLHEAPPPMPDAEDQDALADVVRRFISGLAGQHGKGI